MGDSILTKFCPHRLFKMRSLFPHSEPVLLLLRFIALFKTAITKVDTGADSSVISYGLAKSLQLVGRNDINIDRSCQGVAAGVGRANIVGKLRDVIATFNDGNVEFYVDFHVLDIQDNILILGMDQLRKYNCLIDL